MEEDAPVYVAFANERTIASGPLRTLLPSLKSHIDREAGETLLCFDVATGAQVDFDLRGSIEEILAREAPPRARGRPKLGVSSREVSLLPRHWEWLERQPNGASAALRRLVEQASRQESGRDTSQRIRSALSRFLSAMAGDRPGYEEACRALFARETARFEDLTAPWPPDIRSYALARIYEADEAERGGTR